MYLKTALLLLGFCSWAQASPESVTVSTTATTYNAQAGDTLIGDLSELLNFGRGGSDAGGGDPLAFEVVAVGYKVIDDIRSGVVDLPQVNPTQLARELKDADILFTDQKLMITVGKLVQESAARFDRNSKTIVFNRARWTGIQNFVLKKALVLHELLGLAGLETTGKYPFSQEYLNQLGHKQGLQAATTRHFKSKTVGQDTLRFDAKFVTIPKGRIEFEISDGRKGQASVSQTIEMATTEVTQNQWAAVMGYNPSYFSQPQHCPETHVSVVAKNDAAATSYGMCPEHPVESVQSFKGELQDFLVLLNRRNDGYKYRLPTAEEWIYAARAGNSKFTPFEGDTIKFPRHAWLNLNSVGRTQDVGQLLPNQFGLFDMIGNVSEQVTPIATSGTCGYAGSTFNNTSSDFLLNVATLGYQIPYGKQMLQVRCPEDLREYEGLRLVRERHAQ